MADLFDASELVNIAIREEVSGATFYRALARKADSSDVREFALATAEMEDEHAERFRKLLTQTSEELIPAESYDGEYQDYMAYLVEGRIFPMGKDGEKLAEEQESDMEAVKMAAAMEKHSLLLYQELMQFVPEKDRPMLKEIMDEERLHLLQLSKFIHEHL